MNLPPISPGLPAAQPLLVPHFPSLLAFPAFLRDKADGSAGGIVPASNAFVITTLATLVFILACFVLWFWLIWRRKNQPHLRLLIELHDEDAHPDSPDPLPSSADGLKPGEAGEAQQPWERPADWWQK